MNLNVFALKHLLQKVDGKQLLLTQVKFDFLQGCLMTGCLNGGSCLFDKEKDAFACSCNPQWSGGKCELGKFLFFFPYNKYTIVKEVYCLNQLSVSGKYFSGTKKVRLLADCQYNEPSTL